MYDFTEVVGDMNYIIKVTMVWDISIRLGSIKLLPVDMMTDSWAGMYQAVSTYKEPSIVMVF
jgi:hypothetical protein